MSTPFNTIRFILRIKLIMIVNESKRRRIVYYFDRDYGEEGSRGPDII